jgi:RNA polymerase sigma-70 factor (ECF subfamily)
MNAVPEDSADTRLLLDRIQAGDATAFGRLFERHQSKLLAFLTNRFDARLRARIDPGDIVQETHLEALRRLDDFLERRPMSFRIWLCKTAFERLRMLRRKHLRAGRRSTAREEELPEESSKALSQRLTSAGSSPSRHLNNAERAERVREALARLPALDREILLMRNYEEMAYVEIAALLDIDPAAARQRHGRALSRLSRLLTDAGFGGSSDV